MSNKMGRDESVFEGEAGPSHKRRKLFDSPRWLLLEVTILCAVLLVLWWALKSQYAESGTEPMQLAQAVLDLEQQAVLAGNGALFLSLQVSDPAWISAQLRPEHQAATRAGLTVIHAEQHEGFVWAEVTWNAGRETLQRIVFFQNRAGRLLRLPTAPPNYWGAQWRNEHPWGTLVYYGVDETWAEEVADFVAETVEQVCADVCLESQLPIVLTMAGDYGETAAGGQLRFPSPRLVALDAKGDPAPLYWELLRQQIVRYLTPATIRFAVPPLPNYTNYGGVAIYNYQAAAAEFMATHPNITIEIVSLTELPDDLAVLATDFDGAAASPTEEMLTAGLVHDLTDYIATDLAFDQVDFYKQIWQGVRWQERIWWMPQAANMRMLFYDKDAYALAGHPEPSLGWTWADMSQDIAALIPAQPEGRHDLSWGYMDVGLDTLFSYAFNWDSRCAETSDIACQYQLQTQNVAAAFEWYDSMVGQPGLIPDFTELIPFEANILLMNFQGARRQAVIWVDGAVNYEHQLLLANTGVVPFPGSDKYGGISPLWVYGSFISQQSEHPLAMWEWLKFLSYQRPVPRLIPARPSVAVDAGYWATLPPELDEAMRLAFPLARAITPEEQSYISWTQVKSVVTGEMTPIQAARQRPAVRWFGYSE